MNGSFKKVMAAVLALLMLLACFAGCGGTGSEGTYTVTFNYNGADIAASSVQVNGGECVAAPQDPVREYYAFEGWSTNSLGTDDYDFETPVTENLRLFAKWRQEQATVRFMLGEGEQYASVIVPLGEQVQLPAQDPSRDEYRFGGWYLGTSSEYEFDASEPITGDLTLYAKWLQTSARVTFVLYDGLTDSQVVEIDTVVTPLEDPAREDYEFIGWYDSSACVTLYDFSVPIERNTTIYAGWRLVNASITLEYGDGSDPQVIKCRVGEQLVQPEEPTREGYTFAGWYTDAACTSAYNFEQAVSENFTLYAKWDRQTYTVTFSYNYTGGGSATQSVLYGDSATIPDDPQRTGYDFTGWFTDAACTQAYDFGPVTQAITLYAGWQQSGTSVGGITVNFYLNDGTSQILSTVTLTSPGRLTQYRPDDPARSGYYFAGWYTDPEGTQAFNFSSTIVSSSRNLYAKWLKGYAFEAEYTYLTGKHGQGLSLNTEGPDGLIKGPNVTQDITNQEEAKVSNMHFVGNLFYTGAYLDFEIEAAEDVTDAVLVLRLSPDIHDMILTADEYQVIVYNGGYVDQTSVGRVLGEEDGYTGLELTGAYPEAGATRPDGTPIRGEHEKRPFENYVITVSLSLTAGHNTIRLYTNNNHDHNATFNAETPLVDCMYIYASTELSWYACYPENVKQTEADITYEIEYD